MRFHRNAEVHSKFRRGCHVEIMELSQKMIEFICRNLILKNLETGESSELIIKIGVPYWVEKFESAACPVSCIGSFGASSDIVGVDPMHALELALKFANSLTNSLPKSVELFWPNGEPFETLS